MVELSKEEKISLSDIRFEKSKTMLTDAKKSYEAEMYKTSVNRSYYAILHAARSILILQGVDPSRHEGVKTMLSLHFVKPKLLSQDAIKIFHNLLSMRTDVDYGDFEYISKEDAKESYEEAQKFIEMIESIKKKLQEEFTR